MEERSEAMSMERGERAEAGDGEDRTKEGADIMSTGD